MKRLLYISLLFILAIAGCTGGKNNADADAAQDFTAPPPSASSFDFNGVRIIHQRTSSPLVSVGVVFKGRHAREDSSLAGLESLLLEMLVHGGTHYRKPREVKARAEALGASFETDIRLDHSLLMMQCSQRNFEDAWQLLSEMLLEPAFLPPVFGRVVGNSQEELRLRHKEELFAPIHQSIDRTLHYAHPYRLPLKGTPGSIKRLRNDALFVYYDRMLTAGNIELVFVGNVSRRNIADRLIGTFDELLQESSPPIPDIDWVNAPTPVLMPDSTIPDGRFLARIPGPNTYDAEAVQLELALLCLKSTVQAELCQQRQLTCDFDAKLLLTAHEGAEWRFTTPVPHQTLSYFNAILNRIVDKGPYARELTAAKAQLKYRRFAPQIEQAEQLQVLSRLSAAFGGPGLVGRPQDLTAAINSAEPKAIQRVARKYLAYPHWYYYGNPRKMNAGLFNREVN